MFALFYQPGNMLYRRREKQIKLIDFGMASVMNMDSAATPLPLTECIATLMYQSPELLLEMGRYVLIGRFIHD